jgi:hypothetical protein
MGIFSIFKKGLKKTRDEGITAQLDEVMDSYEKITPEFFDDLEEILIMAMSVCRLLKELFVI